MSIFETPSIQEQRSYGGTQGYANTFSVLSEVKEKLRSFFQKEKKNSGQQLCRYTDALHRKCFNQIYADIWKQDSTYQPHSAMASTNILSAYMYTGNRTDVSIGPKKSKGSTGF